MFDILLPVVVGGVIAIAGGAVQGYINHKYEKKQARIDKREEAYLDYIEALLKIEVDDQFNEVKTTGFWAAYQMAHGKLELYGSEKILKLAREFNWHLQECWEMHSDNGTEAKKERLIEAMRKELDIN